MELINGKLDRKALPVYVAPEGEIERVIAGVWGEMLEVERVGRHDNFFALGGDSLLATGVYSVLQDLFQVKLPLRALGELFENPTIAATATIIAAVGAAKQVDIAAIAGIINEISSLPEQEAKAKLAEKEGQSK